MSASGDTYREKLRIVTEGKKRRMFTGTSRRTTELEGLPPSRTSASYSRPRQNMYRPVRYSVRVTPCSLARASIREVGILPVRIRQ